MLIVEQTMRGEVHDSIPPEIGTQHRIAARIEIQGLESVSGRSQLCDLLGFVAAETQPRKFLSSHAGLRAVGFTGLPVQSSYSPDGLFVLLPDSRITGPEDRIRKDCDRLVRRLPATGLLAQNCQHR